jgi:hypothetical protein
MSQEQNSDKQRSPNRTLVLKPIEGMTALKGTGLTDPRLFTGRNELHAIMDDSTCLWRMRYNDGILPQQLKQSFTSFRLLREHAERYFKQRNIEIVEVKD